MEQFGGVRLSMNAYRSADSHVRRIKELADKAVRVPVRILQRQTSALFVSWAHDQRRGRAADCVSMAAAAAMTARAVVKIFLLRHSAQLEGLRDVLVDRFLHLL